MLSDDTSHVQIFDLKTQIMHCHSNEPEKRKHTLLQSESRERPNRSELSPAN